MSGLPKGWKSTELESLLSFVLGGDWGKDSDFSEEGYLDAFCIRGTEFKRWKKDKGSTSVHRKLKASSLDNRTLQLNDILIEISGGGPDQPVGRTVLIDEEALQVNSTYPKVCTNFIRLARPSCQVHAPYLNHYLRSFYLSGEVTKYQGGSNNLRNLKFKEYCKIEIPVPPYNEQIRIANKLDSILAKVDKAQAHLDKIPAILKRFRQSVLAAATSGGLTKEWRANKGVDFEEWTDTKLSEVATSLDPNPSHRYPKSDSSGVPILSTQQFVGESGWTTDKAKLVNREFYEERKEKTGFFENDIIFARKGRLGLARFAPTNMEFVFSHTVFIVRASEKVQPNYLLWYLRGERSLEWLVKEMNSNTGVPTLGKSVFEKLPINLPCEEEQSEIVSRIERLFSRANKIEKQYLDAKARLDRLTQSILAKAFRGELVPQDPNDEPAEKLLERILAEKEQSKPKKTTRKRTTKAKTAEKE